MANMSLFCGVSLGFLKETITNRDIRPFWIQS